MPKKPLAQVKRISETNSYRGMELPSSKPDDFLGVPMVLLNMVERPGKVRNDTTGRVDPYYELYCVLHEEYDPENEEQNTILVTSGGQFFSAFFHNLDPKELPVAFTFAKKGRSPFME